MISIDLVGRIDGGEDDEHEDQGGAGHACRGNTGRRRGQPGQVRSYLKGQGFGSGFWPNSDPWLIISNDEDNTSGFRRPRAPDPVRILPNPDPAWLSESGTLINVWHQIYKNEKKAIKMI